MLGIPGHVQLSVTAAAFADAVAPSVIAVAVLLPDGQAVAFAGGPMAGGGEYLLVTGRQLIRAG